MDEVDFGIMLGDGPKGLATDLFRLGEVRLIDGKICRGPLSESDSSIECLGHGGVKDMTLILVGDRLAFVIWWSSKGRVEDHAGLLVYIDMVLVDPATNLWDVVLVADNESLFVKL